MQLSGTTWHTSSMGMPAKGMQAVGTAASDGAQQASLRSSVCAAVSNGSWYLDLEHKSSKEHNTVAYYF
jgi:pectin methylesterase-like acyl-CoA thioesterase